MKITPTPSDREVLTGLVERVTYYIEENGFCVRRLGSAARIGGRLVGRNGLLRPGRSEVDLFRYGKGVINLNAEISDRCSRSWCGRAIAARHANCRFGVAAWIPVSFPLFQGIRFGAAKMEFVLSSIIVLLGF
jgi:hypothetical protein